MTQSLTIVSRTSALAMWQAEFVRASLIAHYPELDVKIKGIKTAGDKWLEAPLYEIGGKSLFVKELETCLINGEADLAVHSLKDMPAMLPKGLALAAILQRENPFDAWICPQGATLAALAPNSRVGTSSLRRIAQLKKIRPDLVYTSLRGNVDSRVHKCQAGEWDAIVLAVAGLTRLNLMSHVTSIFTQQQMLPAVAQGALGLECRSDDKATLALIGVLNHNLSASCIRAERAMNHALGGNCKVAVAGYAVLENNEIKLIGRVGCPDTLVMLEATGRGNIDFPEALGQQVATELIQQGALEIIAKMNHD